MQNKLKKLAVRGQRGDTIVEVMIVLAVLGLAIGISYATANRSLQNTRQAQENSQASELLESQVEQLRVSTDSRLYTNPAATTFCMINGTYTPINGSNPCTFSQSGSTCAAADSFCYTISISRCDAVSTTCSAPGTFTATATWPDISGSGNDTVTLDYRMPQLPTGAAGWSDGSGSDSGSDDGSDDHPSAPLLTASLQTAVCSKVKAQNYKVTATINLAGAPGDTVTLTGTSPNMTAVSTTPTTPVLDANGVLSVKFNASYISTDGATAQAKDGSQTQNVTLCSPS
ncbi:MAG TPA: type II secretion system protein [Candidatus Saccharimonadales bacterium]|nr:type II secretion system protein [Candidatus Saccharimonadales bacterium]